MAGTDSREAPVTSSAGAFEIGPPWPAAPVGARLECVKLDPAGAVVTRYPGVVVETGASPPWIVVEARWTLREIVVDRLRFVPGDTLHEFYSPVHPFNVFRIQAPDGEVRGWYANVTYPTVMEAGEEGLVLYWRDLYLDLIQYPDGSFIIRDEDELAESGLVDSDPVLHAAIVSARDELTGLARDRLFPFVLP